MSQFLRIDPDAPAYREFCRLYEIAKELRSYRVDRWNRELSARTDALWGGLDPRTGGMRLSAYKVLPYLTGPPGHSDREATARALQTTLHEMDHCFIAVDVADHPGEPRPANIVRTIESKALDEGLTEYLAARDLRAFARRAGYGRLASVDHEYPGAHEATRQLLAYAAPDRGRRELLADRARLRPVVMRWDAIADELVRTRLEGVVPLDHHEQLMARAQLVQAMAHHSWQQIHDPLSQRISGALAAHHSIEAVENAIRDLRNQYRTRAIAAPGDLLPSDHTLDLSQARILDPSSDPGTRAALGQLGPAAEAVRRTPAPSNPPRPRPQTPAHRLDPPGRR